MGAMRVVKVRASPASRLRPASRARRPIRRSRRILRLASRRVARAVDVVSVADRARRRPFPPLPLAARLRVALPRRARLGRGSFRGGGGVGDDARPPRARSTPARGFHQRRERAPRPRLLLRVRGDPSPRRARRLRQDGPLGRSPHRHLRRQALLRRLLPLPRLGRAGSILPRVRPSPSGPPARPRPDHHPARPPRWSNPPATSPARPCATTKPRSRRTRRLAEPLASPPFAPHGSRPATSPRAVHAKRRGSRSRPNYPRGPFSEFKWVFSRDPGPDDAALPEFYRHHRRLRPGPAHANEF